VGLAVSQVWSQLEWNAGRVPARDLSWVSTALATSLDAGLDWFSAISVAAECADGDLKLRLVAIAQRLEWGIEPSAAFAGEDFGLAEISAAISQTHSSGAPISHALFRTASAVSAQSHAGSLKRVEKLASFAVVPVTALQLPAFIVLGLVPVVITQLQPLLTAFSSSRVLL
jgi:tight adherence protein B